MNAIAHRRIRLAPTLRNVRRAVEALQRLLPQALPQAQRDALGIALAEVLNNIVLHGFAGVAAAPIEVDCSEDAHAFVVEVRDRGRAIPGAILDAADGARFDFESTELGDLPEGGFGLGLVKLAFDVVDYRSEAGVNHMRLEKRLR